MINIVNSYSYLHKSPLNVLLNHLCFGNDLSVDETKEKMNDVLVVCLSKDTKLVFQAVPIQFMQITQ